VVGFVAYGLLLALVWVPLRAVDVALAEAAIGGGLSGVLLLGAAARAAAGRGSGDGVPRLDPLPGGWDAVGRGRGGARRRGAAPSRPCTHARTGGCRERGGDRPRQSCHQRADGFSRARHLTREGRAVACPSRRVVAGA